MNVILLENIRNLGPFGKTVKVAKGYGRNFLLPQGKAVSANPKNVAMFESRRQEFETVVQERLAKAQERAESLRGTLITITVRAAEEGKLYGSVNTVDIVRALTDMALTVERQEIRLPMGPIREIGDHEVELHLHADVVVPVIVRVVAEAAKV
jgi:large subunit ribosomal protein L9